MGASDVSTELGPEEALWDALKWEEPTTADELQRTLFTPSERTQLPIRDMARTLNMKGYPVVSNGRGFYKTRKPSELSRYALSLFSRAKGIMERAEAVLRMASSDSPENE